VMKKQALRSVVAAFTLLVARCVSHGALASLSGDADITLGRYLQTYDAIL